MYPGASCSRNSQRKSLFTLNLVDSASIPLVSNVHLHEAKLTQVLLGTLTDILVPQSLCVLQQMFFLWPWPDKKMASSCEEEDAGSISDEYHEDSLPGKKKELQGQTKWEAEYKLCRTGLCIFLKTTDKKYVLYIFFNLKYMHYMFYKLQYHTADFFPKSLKKHSWFY